MPLQIRIQLGSSSRFNSFYYFLNPLSAQKPHLAKTLTPATVEMAAESGPAKRPICPKCSKPAQICLCSRLKTPALHNSIAVTILQHNLEKKHPLNSTRIATIGLKDVSIISVSDVNFQARFFMHLLEPDRDFVSGDLEEKSSDFGERGSSKRKWDSVERPVSLSGFDKGSDFCGFSDGPKEKSFTCIDLAGEFGEGLDPSSLTKSEFSKSCMDTLREKGEFLANDGVQIHPELKIYSGSKESTSSRKISEWVAGSLAAERDDEDTASCTSAEAFPINNVSRPCSCPNRAVSGGAEGAVIAFTTEKYGAIKSFFYHWMLPYQCQKWDNFDHLLASEVAAGSVAKGFVVKKFQTKQLNGTVDLEEFEEFEIKIPSGSVLLFPSEKSVGIEAIDFEVKNLIVLDGTWAKAKRMYNENPWLKLLPHLKLETDKLSLYSEVRHQPRAGFLSTIESIVYALKAFGENSEKLDDLLDLFESMVGDQRRCKSERLRRVSTKPLNS